MPPLWLCKGLWAWNVATGIMYAMVPREPKDEKSRLEGTASQNFSFMLASQVYYVSVLLSFSGIEPLTVIFEYKLAPKIFPFLLSSSAFAASFPVWVSLHLVMKVKRFFSLSLLFTGACVALLSNRFLVPKLATLVLPEFAMLPGWGLLVAAILVFAFFFILFIGYLLALLTSFITGTRINFPISHQSLRSMSDLYPIEQAT